MRVSLLRDLRVAPNRKLFINLKKKLTSVVKPLFLWHGPNCGTKIVIETGKISLLEAKLLWNKGLVSYPKLNKMLSRNHFAHFVRHRC